MVQRLPRVLFIWVSGVTGVTIGNLDASLIGRGGRIKVDSFNRVEGMNNVFAIGDQCIQLADGNYPNGHPQLAQVAIQQGGIAGKESGTYGERTGDETFPLP